MPNQTRRRISKISALHYFKLVYRSLLLVLAAVIYIVLISRGEVDLRAQLRRFPILLGLIWVLYVGEMILRFFPSRLESMGCQKQFRKNYIPTENGAAPTRRFRGVWMVALSWFALNGAIGALYYTGVIDSGILLLISNLNFDELETFRLRCSENPASISRLTPDGKWEEVSFRSEQDEIVIDHFLGCYSTEIFRMS